MIESRPDWCVSRQRAWGVPLPIFVRRADGEVLRDQNVLDRIVKAFGEEGADCWFDGDAPQRFLGNDYDPQDYEQIFDVVDVWFDSGSTHSFVLDKRKGLSSPADLYLEGSDQHRGWFHSSLLVGAGLNGSAPYKNILTHGFVLDKNGHKMSKSLGNTIAPEDVIEKYGADILRLWVVSLDYKEDLKISDEILKQQADKYRKIRNVLRFLLGNLQDNLKPTKIPYEDLPELEQVFLYKTYLLEQALQRTINDYDYTQYIRLLTFYCQELSSFYFEIRKDCLYCDAPSNPKRKAALYVLSELFDFLVTRLAPILCFTAEEAWQYRYGKFSKDGDKQASVFAGGFSEVPDEWQNEDKDFLNRWKKIFHLRFLINSELESARVQKNIASGLEASVQKEILKEDKEFWQNIGTEMLAEIMIVSQFSFRETQELSLSNPIKKAQGTKCVRCWKIIPDEAEMTEGRCQRCHDAYNENCKTQTQN